MKKTVVFALTALLLLVSAVTVFSGNRTLDPLGVSVAPQTLILDMEQGAVSVHTDIPLRLVDTSSLALNGLAPTATKADARGCLVAYFEEESVKAIVSTPEATLTLTGCTTDGEQFSGSDTVRVIAKG